MVRSGFLLLFTTLSSLAFGQAKSRLLPSNINKPSINYYAPFISGDGRTLLYLHDYTDEGHHAMMTATKKTVSTWNDGIEVNKLINRPTLNYRGGYSLSFDGDMLYFSSRKSGLGGFDLWSSKRNGNDWQAPKNLGSPTNSRENEGGPCLSPDGEYLYFMCCEKMSEYGGASGCRIVRSKRTNSGWAAPVDLPANINTGNSQTPRILADGVSMIFASDKLGGAGGLDLFLTKMQGENWSQPVPLEFLNTPKNDQFVTTDAKGRYMYVAENTGRNSQLMMKLIPKELQPAKVMRIKGQVTNADGSPLKANLTIFNIDDRDRLWNEKLSVNGEFAIVLNEGASYDLAVESQTPGVMYYSKVFDLQQVGARDKQTLTIKLEPIELEKPYTTEIRFEDHRAKITDNSTFELRRISNMMRKNPQMSIELTAYLDLYKSDSIQSDPDLTELRIDSIYVEREVAIPIELDTTQVLAGDSLYLDSLSTDTTFVEVQELRDSVKYETVQELHIKNTFHNDRTHHEVDAVKEYIVDRGINASRIQIRTQVNKQNVWRREELEDDTEHNKTHEIRSIGLRVLKM
ncbi:MAG: hypothetical protein AAGF85_16530 [Bacteroidota bacterium]